MTELLDLVARLKRPRILIRAAHHGLQDYNRNRDLRRLLSGAAPAPREAVERLLREEEDLDSARKCGRATYSVARHVDVMIAILAELRLLGRDQPA